MRTVRGIPMQVAINCFASLRSALATAVSSSSDVWAPSASKPGTKQAKCSILPAISCSYIAAHGTTICTPVAVAERQQQDWYPVAAAAWYPVEAAAVAAAAWYPAAAAVAAAWHPAAAAVWLSDKTGINYWTVVRYCSNESQPRLDKLKQIASVLKVRMSDLIIDIEGD